MAKKPSPSTLAEPIGRLKVEYRKLSELVPYTRNSRTHSPEQVAAIAKSIETFGWTNPILIDGQNGIVAGHGRMAAAKLLGMDKVPVIELHGLTEAQKRAYVVADNQIALNASWDFDALAIEVPELKDEGIDLSLLGNLDLSMLEAKDPVQTWKTPAIKFNITFDNTEQQQAWFEFIRRLQQEFPTHPTIAARICAFLARVKQGGAA